MVLPAHQKKKKENYRKKNAPGKLLVSRSNARNFSFAKILYT